MKIKEILEKNKILLIWITLTTIIGVNAILVHDENTLLIVPSLVGGSLLAYGLDRLLNYQKEKRTYNK